jgi:hypothetical protein
MLKIITEIVHYRAVISSFVMIINFFYFKIYIAIIRGRYDVVEYLIVKGADIKNQDISGWTPIISGKLIF